jgi:cytidylate kinase
MPVITIDRLAGTRDSEVARMVAERLGYRVLDEDINQLVQARLGRPRLPAWDERLPGHETWFLAFASAMAGEYVPRDDRLTGAATEYLRATRSCIREAAAGGSVVIVGREAAALLGDRGDCLRVFLTGAEGFRIGSVAQERGLTVDKARTEVRRLDRARRDYSSRLSARRLDDPRHYHLVIDTATLGVEPATDMICAAAIARFAEVEAVLTHS